MSAFDILSGVYELSTVVTDVILNNEYIKRGWREEYTLSIVFLAFNSVVMAVVGLQMDAHEAKNRYARATWLNKTIVAVIGMLQLRVLMETVHTYMASSGKEKDDHYQQQQQQNQQQQHQPQSQPQPIETRDEKIRRLERGLVYVAFIQAMVRDVPLFVIQSNATIHYRKWEIVDLWAVSSTGVTLMNAVAGFVTKRDDHSKDTTSTTPSSHSKMLDWSASGFLIGQFVFRLGSILLVANTTGLTIVIYASVLTVIGVTTAIAWKLASPTPTTSAQVSSALLLFPLFTVFSLDLSHLGLHHTGGNAKEALYGYKLLALNMWRVLENCAGIVLAIAGPRYTDFGETLDSEITLIGGVCLGIYLVSFVVFAVVARSTKTTTGSSNTTMGEDTTMYLRNQPQQFPQQQPQQPYQKGGFFEEEQPRVQSPYVNPGLLPPSTQNQSQHLPL